MKTRLVLFAVLLSVLPRPVHECYRIDQTRFVRILISAGADISEASFARMAYIPGEYASMNECNRAIASLSQQYHHNEPGRWKDYVECVPCKGSSGSSANSASPLEGLVRRVVDFFLKDTSAEDAAARENLFKQQEAEREADRLAKEKADSQALNKWNEDKKSAALKKAEDEAKKLEESNRLLGNIGTTGGGELTFKTIGTNFFGTANPTEVTLQPKSGRYTIPNDMTTLQTLQGAAYFLTSAVDAGDYEGAAFLAEQADKMVQRQPTNIPWKLTPLPNVPAAPSPEEAAAQKQKMTVLIDTFKKDVSAIRAVQIKINELDARIKTAEREKETARIKKQEAEAKTVTAKPEEKAQADELLRLARLAEEEADGQAAKLNEEKTARVKEEEKRKTDLKDLENQIKNLGK